MIFLKSSLLIFLFFSHLLFFTLYVCILIIRYVSSEAMMPTNCMSLLHTAYHNCHVSFFCHAFVQDTLVNVTRLVAICSQASVYYIQPNATDKKWKKDSLISFVFAFIWFSFTHWCSLDVYWLWTTIRIASRIVKSRNCAAISIMVCVNEGVRLILI